MAYIPTTEDIRDAASSTGICPIDDPEFTYWLHIHDSEIIASVLRSALNEVEHGGVDALRTLSSANQDVLEEYCKYYGEL